MNLGFGWGGIQYNPQPWTAAMQTLEQTYMLELKGHGVTHIRPNIPDYTTAATYYRDQQLTLNGLAAGFTGVSFGISSNSFNAITNKLTLSRWAAYRAFTLTEDGSGVGSAIWAKQHGVTTYFIGNEEGTHHVYKSVNESSSHGKVTLTSSGTTAIATLTQSGAVWGYTNGQNVTIANASQAEYNGTFAITLVSDTVFTYTMSGDPVDTATGNFYVYDISPAEMIANMKTLAADVKAAWAGIAGTDPRIALSITTDGFCTTDTELNGWIAAGKGTDIDVLGINVYGSGSESTFYTMAKAAWDAFGTGAIITEFNVHQTWGSVNINGFTPSSLSQSGFHSAYARALVDRKNILETLGFEEAYFFTYFNITVSDGFSVKLADGDSTGFRAAFVSGHLAPAFFRLLGKRASCVEIN